MEKIRDRLKRSAGESLVEVLCALLLSSLGLMLLGGMIQSSFKLLRISKERFDYYVKAENKLMGRTSDETESGNIHIQPLIKLTDKSKDSGIDVTYYTEYYNKDKNGNVIPESKVISYEVVSQNGG